MRHMGEFLETKKRRPVFALLHRRQIKIHQQPNRLAGRASIRVEKLKRTAWRLMSQSCVHPLENMSGAAPVSAVCSTLLWLDSFLDTQRRFSESSDKRSRINLLNCWATLEKDRIAVFIVHVTLINPLKTSKRNCPSRLREQKIRAYKISHADWKVKGFPPCCPVKCLFARGCDIKAAVVNHHLLLRFTWCI